MLTIKRESQNTMGDSVHKVRLALGLSRQQLAVMAGVTIEAVYQYENSLPVSLNSRRKILKELWAFKTARSLN
ncbi:MAG TPA: helix-turn-helix domain-containing protein [Dehalococcoidales bacterium]|nr:helix-turn-helix domain-containing protein [Dehalococcoidales bacterium]